MKHVYFITGYSGFVASKLVDEILKNFPDSIFYLLVLKNEKPLAGIQSVSTQENLHIVEGDITKEDLGIALYIKKQLIERVTHCVHLAAYYDLTAELPHSYACNVKGTKHVVNFVKECKNIKRFCYFSTAYVSGKRKGKIKESELIEPPAFRNHYEQTKYEAEKYVRAFINVVPTTIIRPGIIVGDSKTGETIKFDGPYFIMNFLKKLSKVPIPSIGRSTSNLYLVPVDFIVKATVYLMHDNCGESKTYHMLSNRSPKVREAYSLICKELIGKEPTWSISAKKAEQMLRIPFVSKWLGVPLQTLSYFSHEAVYDTAQLDNDLKNSGISCPEFSIFLKPMVRYYKKNAKNPLYKKY
jgi:nucleoside-diphosphate-sugar epimerase